MNETRTWTEAPSSCTVKFSLDGFDTMLTIRDDTGKGALEKIQAAIKHLRNIGAMPTSGNGHKSSGGNGSAPTCPTHGTPMKRSKHNSGWYCPQKVAETGGGADGSKPIYCKAKA